MSHECKKEKAWHYESLQSLQEHFETIFSKTEKKIKDFHDKKRALYTFQIRSIFIRDVILLQCRVKNIPSFRVYRILVTEKCVACSNKRGSTLQQ